MKTALITGASGGIGSAAARRLASDGFAVAIHYYNNESAANALRDEILKSGGTAVTVRADVSSSAEVGRMIDFVARELGHIDVLVNSAGIAEQKLFTDITDEDFDVMIKTNLSGVFYVCRAVLPSMIHRKSGRIINIASMWGETGGACEVHYSAAKAGVIGLTKALAKEVGPSGITVNAVSPGAVDTAMLAHFSDADIAALADETPLCRIGKPEDVAAAVSFLASDGASFITGQVISVNGGFVI